MISVAGFKRWADEAPPMGVELLLVWADGAWTTDVFENASLLPPALPVYWQALPTAEAVREWAESPPTEADDGFPSLCELAGAPVLLLCCVDRGIPRLRAKGTAAELRAALAWLTASMEDIIETAEREAGAEEPEP